jgi:hypothetical protein
MIKNKKNPLFLHSVDSFDTWATNAIVGEVAIYYIGDLANGRFGHDPDAVKMGAMAWKLQESGRFLLTQRRPSALAPGIFHYLITCCKTEAQVRNK